MSNIDRWASRGEGSRSVGVLVALLVGALPVAACSPDEGDQDGGGGGDGAYDRGGSDRGGSDRGGGDGGGDGGGGDTLPPGCVEAARWIYLVDESKEFIRFYPDELRLETVGTLNCRPETAGAAPFSMAVDRNAVAWVLYYSFLADQPAELFRVSTADANCAGTTFERGQHDFAVFGMGFASNSPHSEDETLYVAGGPSSYIGSEPVNENETPAGRIYCSASWCAGAGATAPT